MLHAIRRVKTRRCKPVCAALDHLCVVLLIVKETSSTIEMYVFDCQTLRRRKCGSIPARLIDAMRGAMCSHKREILALKDWAGAFGLLPTLARRWHGLRSVDAVEFGTIESSVPGVAVLNLDFA